MFCFTDNCFSDTVLGDGCLAGSPCVGLWSEPRGQAQREDTEPVPPALLVGVQPAALGVRGPSALPDVPCFSRVVI